MSIVFRGKQYVRNITLYYYSEISIIAKVTSRKFSPNLSQNRKIITTITMFFSFQVSLHLSPALYSCSINSISYGQTICIIYIKHLKKKIQTHPHTTKKSNESWRLNTRSKMFLMRKQLVV